MTLFLYLTHIHSNHLVFWDKFDHICFVIDPLMHVRHEHNIKIFLMQDKVVVFVIKRQRSKKIESTTDVLM